MKRLVLTVLALLLAMLVAPSASAQSTDWQEVRTKHFAILYAAGDEQTAQQYAGFVDSIYDEIGAVFGHFTPTPVTLRLFPTMESYYQVNPLARNLPGIVAHADYRRHEVVVLLPQTQRQTPDEVQNNIRHELTHIVASDVSESRLNVLFQEGLAQYVEKPSGELETKINLLKDALSNNTLLSWEDLNDRDTFYSNAQITYPQSLSVVAFLVDRYQFSTFRDMLATTARSSGYRSALERTYGVAPDTLEQQWRDWLPEYLAGGYKLNALNAYDLSKAKTLIEQGRYADAQQELGTVLKWLGNSGNQPDVLEQARALQATSETGLQAERVANAAREALTANDYNRANELIGQARSLYDSIGDTNQQTVLDTYAERAARGLDAESMLQQAYALASGWRYPQARAAADRAAAEFVALGAADRADQATTLRSFMDQRQSWAGLALLGFGVLGIGISAVRRFSVREAEAW